VKKKWSNDFEQKLHFFFHMSKINIILYKLCANNDKNNNFFKQQYVENQNVPSTQHFFTCLDPTMKTTGKVIKNHSTQILFATRN